MNFCCYFSIILASDHQRRLEQPCHPATFLFTVVGTTGFLGVLAGRLPGFQGTKDKGSTIVAVDYAHRSFFHSCLMRWLLQ
ncbi:unnamed protein product [Camellia sinensis]